MPPLHSGQVAPRNLHLFDHRNRHRRRRNPNHHHHSEGYIDRPAHHRCIVENPESDNPVSALCDIGHVLIETTIAIIIDTITTAVYGSPLFWCTGINDATAFASRLPIGRTSPASTLRVLAYEAFVNRPSQSSSTPSQFVSRRPSPGWHESMVFPSTQRVTPVCAQAPRPHVVSTGMYDSSKRPSHRHRLRRTKHLGLARLQVCIGLLDSQRTGARFAHTPEATGEVTLIGWPIAVVIQPIAALGLRFNESKTTKCPIEADESPRRTHALQTCIAGRIYRRCILIKQTITIVISPITGFITGERLSNTRIPGSLSMFEYPHRNVRCQCFHWVRRNMTEIHSRLCAHHSHHQLHCKTRLGAAYIIVVGVGTIDQHLFAVIAAISIGIGHLRITDFSLNLVRYTVFVAVEWTPKANRCAAGYSGRAANSST